MYVQFLRKPEVRGARATGVTDGWELPCGCWELDLHPLEEQEVLLTTEPPPALQTDF